MADIKVWCLLLNYVYKPTFGEPFPVSIHRDSTIHRLKIGIYADLYSPTITQSAVNTIAIWRCKSSKLSAKDSFDQTMEKIDEFGFPGTWRSHVQHLGVAQKVNELQLEGDELLLVVMPRA